VDEVKEITDFAKNVFLIDGYHAPTVIVKGTQTSAAIQLPKFGATASERQMDMLNTGTWLASKHNVGDLELIVHISEGWIGTNMNILPSQDPNRTEVLLINSLDVRTQEERLLIFEVKRDLKGTVTDLIEIVFPNDVSSKGRLLPAFLKGYQIVSPVHN
jgi:hypothetical protein